MLIPVIDKQGRLVGIVTEGDFLRTAPKLERRDHVAPWRSVHKFHFLADADITFVLTNGGHNAGVLSEPGHRNRHFRMALHRHGEQYVDPDTWLTMNSPQEGSWWPAWSEWLAERSAAPVPPPPLGRTDGKFAPLEDAPGRYVLMK
jgi:polyhydroxyalkanoate synthase